MASADAVLITRPTADAHATAQLVQARGFTPVIAPLLQVDPVSIGAVAGLDGVIVTSGNALAALTGCLDLPLLAVGDATAKRAHELGFRRVFSAGGDAAALIGAAPKHFPVGARLLFATTGDEGAVVTDALGRAGFVVDRRIAYAVRPALALPALALESLTSGRLHAALFLSARTAQVFAGLLAPADRRHLARVDALVIGQPAADALTPLPWRRVRVSLTPTLDQVLALL